MDTYKADVTTHKNPDPNPNPKPNANLNKYYIWPYTNAF